jgi:aminocarboxymuconate-semialdehyde decarboxylase
MVCRRNQPSSMPSRRRFLEIAGLLAAGPLLAARRAGAQRTSASAVDVHAHYFPMEYLRGMTGPGGPAGFSVDLAATAGPTLTGGGAVTVLDASCWDVNRRLEAMDRAGVRVQALSLSMPMPHTAPAERGVLLARIYNDAAIAACAKHPDRFVGCIALPLHDITMSAVEIDRVSGEKAMRAVYLPTSINGKELSDPSLSPLFRKIQALNLPVMLHPHPEAAVPDRLRPFGLQEVLGTPFDTTLAVCHLVFGGVMDRFPRLNVLLPQAGGAFPFLYGRVQRGQQVVPDLKNAAEHPVADYLKRFYYDTLTHSPDALKFLIEVAGADRVLLGSDFCFDMGYDGAREMVASLAIPPADRDRILFANARRLLQLEGAS